MSCYKLSLLPDPYILKNTNLIQIRGEMYNKYFSDEYSNLFTPDQKTKRNDKLFFTNYINECSSNLNTAESCLILAYFLGESASQTVRTKEILDTKIINLLIDYAEQICIDLERTILICSSLKVLFYHQLSRFLIAVCHDIEGFFLFSTKAIKESENDYVKLYLFVQTKLNSRKKYLDKAIIGLDIQSSYNILSTFTQQTKYLITNINDFYSQINSNDIRQIKYSTQDEESIAKFQFMLDNGKDLNTQLINIYIKSINIIASYKIDNEILAEDLIMEFYDEFSNLYQVCNKSPEGEEAMRTCQMIYNKALHRKQDDNNSFFIKLAKLFK